MPDSHSLARWACCWQVFDLTYAYKLGYKGHGPTSVPWPRKRAWASILADRLVDTVRFLQCLFTLLNQCGRAHSADDARCPATLHPA